MINAKGIKIGCGQELRNAGVWVGWGSNCKWRDQVGRTIHRERSLLYLTESHEGKGNRRDYKQVMSRLRARMHLSDTN